MPQVPSDIFAAAGRQDLSRSPLRFPLALCIWAMFFHGLALTAAICNVRWSARPPAAVEAFDLAWLYVNLSWLFSWFLLWPALALRTPPQPAVMPHPRVAALFLDLLTLLIAVLPAGAVAAWLSEIPPEILSTTLALQGGFALFALGLLSWRNGTSPRATLLAGLLAFLALGLPMLAYLAAEFRPALAGPWTSAAPALALAAASNALPLSAAATIALPYALTGLLLLSLAGLRRPS